MQSVPTERLASHVFVVIRALLVTLLVACASLVVQAQGDAPRAPRLRYRAARECPSKASFEAALRSHASRAPQPAGTTPPRMDVQLKQSGTRAVGELLLEGGGGSEPARRRIEAATCAEAADALAFVAALLLEERRAERAREVVSPTPAETPTPAAPPTPPSPPATSEVAPEANSEPTRTEPTPATTTAQKPAPDEDEEPLPTPPTREEPRRRTSRVRLPRSARATSDGDAAPIALSAEVLASGLLLTGVAPSLNGGGALSGSLGFSHVLVRAGVRASLPQRVTSTEGDARFGFYAGMLAACGELSAAARVALAVCAVGELGRVVARGQDTSAPRSVRRSWFGVGPRAHVSVRVVGPLRIEPGVELMVPLTRDRFEIGGLSLHRVPSLTIRAELALGVRFE